MDLDLREALSHGFGPEPPHRVVSDRIEAGHRAVRRRRLAGGVVAVAAAGVLGLGTVVLLGGDDPVTTQVATDPETTSADQPGTAPTAGWDEGELARYTDAGDLELRPGTTTLGWIDSPYPPRAGMDRSVAVALDYEGDETWVLLSWSKDAEGKVVKTGESFVPGGAAETFEEWVEVMVRLNMTPRPEDNSAGYVSFAQDGSLVSSHGVEILDQRHPVNLKDFTFGDEASAAALLRGPDGKKWFVLVRYADDPDVIAVPFETVGTDLEGFLNYATQKYANGEGLR